MMLSCNRTDGNTGCGSIRQYVMKKFFSKSCLLIIGLLLNVLVMVLPAQAQHIAAGRIHSLYLDPAGQVWVWGGASLESAANERIPQLAMTDAQAVFANPEKTLSYVIKKNGSLWGWGNSRNGQLGVIRSLNDYSSEYIERPREIAKDIVFVTGSGTIFALKLDHTLWVWGSFGIERGDNIKKSFIKPLKKMNDVLQVSSSSTHTLALKTDSTLLAWGDNQCGALGTGNTDDSIRPVRVNVKALGKRKIVKIATRNGESFAIADDGSVWCWGEGNIMNPFCKDELRLTPVRIVDMDNVKDIATGLNTEIYLKKDGTVWDLIRDTPNAKPDWRKVLDDVKEIAAGQFHFIALKNDGTVWTWGMNNYGQLGNGTTEGRNLPAQMFFPKNKFQ